MDRDNMIREDLSKEIGQQIRKKRLELGYSQERMCEYLGLNQNALSRLETGKSHMNLNKLVKICNLFKVDLNYFVPLESYDLRDKRIKELEELTAALHKRNEILQQCLEELIKIKK